MRGPAEARTPQGGRSRIIAMNTPAFRPRIVILYCTQCQWLLRAGWMAQELLSTFSTDLGEVVLQPGTGGIFQITYNGDLIWDRKSDGGFPEAKVLKQRCLLYTSPSPRD